MGDWGEVREAIASGMVHFEFVEGSMNPADILSKHWGYSNVWPLLQPLLFHQGDTLDISDNSNTSDGTAHTDGEWQAVCYLLGHISVSVHP